MFKDKLKKLREEKGLTQDELADIICVSRSAIAKWENGGGYPNDAGIESLCNYFHISKEILFEKDKENKKEVVKVKKRSWVLIILSILGIIVPISLAMISFIGIYTFDRSDPNKIYAGADFGKRAISDFISGHIIYSLIVYAFTFSYSILNLCKIIKLNNKKNICIQSSLIVICILAFIITLIFASIAAKKINWIL